MNPPEKPHDGAYYTPPEIAHAISLRLIFYWFESHLQQSYYFETFLEDLGNKQLSIELSKLEQEKLFAAIDSIQILDPAVGAGSLILSILKIFEELMEILGKNYDRIINKRSEFIKEHISGWDIQNSAVLTTQIELHNWCEGKEPHFYKNGTMLDNNSNIKKNTFSDRIFVNNTLFFESPKQYNIIIANPPYGNLLTSEEKQKLKRNFKCRLGEVVELFLEKGLQILKPNSNAFLCYIVPKTITFYQQWAKIRKLLFEFEIKEIMDLGIAFQEVNLEQIAIIIGTQTKENKKLNQSMITLSKAEPLKRVEKQLIQRVGQIPKSLIQKNQLLIFAPLIEQDLKILQDMEKNSDWLPSLGRNYPLEPFPNVMKRSIYISNTEKAQVKSGETFFINKVPDLSEKGIEKIYQITPPCDISDYLYPKLMFKVFRGSRMAVFADPIGNIVTTEKIVNFFLDPKHYQYIWGIQAILNSRPPSFYLQAVVFSQTTESSRVMDPFYAKFIPLPKISNHEWEEITNWSKLLLIAYYENMHLLSRLIKEIIECKAIIYYFQNQFNDLRESLERFLSQNQQNLLQLFEIAQIKQFDNFFPKIIESRILDLPFSTNKKENRNQTAIWKDNQKIEINKLTESLERSLNLENLKQSCAYKQLYQFLGK